MKGRKWNFLVYLHAGLFLWAALFLYCLHLPGNAASYLAPGMFFFIFADIPLAVCSFLLTAKGRFDKPYKVPILILSILNCAVGLAAWYCLVLVLLKPS